jgi:hypothetical protein
MHHRPPHSSASLVSLVAVLVSLAGGCTQEPNCPALDDCGGTVPYGTWELAPGHPSCSEDLYTPPPDPRSLPVELPPAREPPREPAFFDWCYLLVTNNGDKIQTRQPRFYAESPKIGWASLTYRQDGTYDAGISRVGTFYFYFPPLCIRASGAMDGKPAIDQNGMAVTGPVHVCKQLEVPLGESGIGEGSYPNVICVPNAEDPPGAEGCICQYEMNETRGGSGPFLMASNNTIMHLPGNNYPQRATFCNKGGTLQLTGANGNYLFGEKGLRTLDLVPAGDPCMNGRLDPSEEGVDCGGGCAPCAAPAMP